MSGYREGGSQIQYGYVCVERGKKRLYLSRDASPILLASLLFFRGRPIGFPGNGIRRVARNCKRLLRAFTIILYSRLIAPNTDEVIWLPVPGHLCLKGKTGYKVFNLEKQVVVKLFYSDTYAGEIRREIEWARRAGAYRFGPTVRRWNAEEGWYEEDYVNGYPMPGSGWTIFLATLHQSLLPVLAELSLAAAPRVVDALDYARRLGEEIRDKLLQVSDGRLDAEKVAMVGKFVVMTTEKLRARRHDPIYLVLSHGDFYPGHVLTTGNGPLLIDWEAAGHRSALFDLYHVFFRRFVGHGMPSGVPATIEGAISRLQSCVTSHASADRSSLISSLDGAEVYRFVYYIECIRSYANRGGGEKVSPTNLNHILSFMEIYDRYERQLPNGADRCFFL